MLRQRPIVLACLLLLGGCQSAPVSAPAPAAAKPADSGQWVESTLSEQTKDKVKAAIGDYNRCLMQETDAMALARDDPRSITNAILKACEDRLAPIKDAYDAEHVPAEISQRHQRQVRSRGMQRVLLAVESIHAQRAGEEQEEKAAQQATPKKQKTKPKPSTH